MRINSHMEQKDLCNGPLPTLTADNFYSMQRAEQFHILQSEKRAILNEDFIRTAPTIAIMDQVQAVRERCIGKIFVAEVPHKAKKYEFQPKLPREEETDVLRELHAWDKDFTLLREKIDKAIDACSTATALDDEGFRQLRGVALQLLHVETELKCMEREWIVFVYNMPLYSSGVRNRFKYVLCKMMGERLQILDQLVDDQQDFLVDYQ